MKSCKYFEWANSSCLLVRIGGSFLSSPSTYQQILHVRGDSGRIVSFRLETHDGHRNGLSRRCSGTEKTQQLHIFSGDGRFLSENIPCSLPSSRRCVMRSQCDRCCLRFMPVQLACRSIKKRGHVGVRARANAPALRRTETCRAAQRWRIGRYSTAIVWVRIQRCALGEYYFQYYEYCYYLHQPRRVLKCFCVSGFVCLFGSRVVSHTVPILSSGMRVRNTPSCSRNTVGFQGLPRGTKNCLSCSRTFL